MRQYFYHLISVYLSQIHIKPGHTVLTSVCTCASVCTGFWKQNAGFHGKVPFKSGWTLETASPRPSSIYIARKKVKRCPRNRFSFHKNIHFYVQNKSFLTCTLLNLIILGRFIKNQH